MNKFIGAFTKPETEAVQKLRQTLPEVLTNAELAGDYKLWNIPFDKDATDDRLDVLLVKFLRARNLSVNDAAEMLTKMLIWRRDFGADKLLDETFDEAVFGKVGFYHKQDKEGRPVCYNFYGDLDQDKVFGDIQRFIRWRVQLMEKGVRMMDFVSTDSMIQVHDYKGASMFGRTANAKAATKETIAIMQDNYPEFLATKFFVNVPWWGSAIFKLVRPLLSEATVKKFVVCSSDELVETLSTAINKEDIPPVYLPANSSKSDDKAEEVAEETKGDAAATQRTQTSSGPEPKTPPKDTGETLNVPEPVRQDGS